jgi:hypothetical protein
MHNIHNVFHIRLSLFLKQLDMNEEDILRITRTFYNMGQKPSYVDSLVNYFGEGWNF